MVVKTLYQAFQLANSQLGDTIISHEDFLFLLWDHFLVSGQGKKKVVKNVILNICFSFFEFFFIFLINLILI